MENNRINIFSNMPDESLMVRKKESAVDIVINNIKYLLLEKKLKPGDRLPNETELSNVLQVSRGSVREAMKILSAFGIIDIRRGDGTYIKNSSNKILFDPLLFNLILADSDIKEFVELREAIEFEVIRLILQNATEEDKKNIELAHMKYLELEKDENIDLKTLAEYDIKFHHELGKATNNKLVERIYEFILDFFRPSIEKTHNHQEIENSALDSHTHIVEAIKSNDYEKAYNAIKKSIVVWEKLYLNGRNN